MRRLAPVIAVALLVAPLFACGPENELSGSIEDELSLAFQTVEALKQEHFLTIQYVRFVGPARAKVLELVVDTKDAGISSGTMLEGEAFLSRTVFDRLTKLEERFPPLASGRLRFDTFEFYDRGYVEGSFKASFQEGRTLNGTFRAPVVELSL